MLKYLKERLHEKTSIAAASAVFFALAQYMSGSMSLETLAATIIGAIVAFLIPENKDSQLKIAEDDINRIVAVAFKTIHNVIQEDNTKSTTG